MIRAFITGALHALIYLALTIGFGSFLYGDDPSTLAADIVQAAIRL